MRAFFESQQDLQIGNEARGVSFHLRQGHPYGLKIRLEANRERCVDFYCKCDGNDEIMNGTWEAFITYMTKRAEDCEQWEAKEGRIRHYLVKRTPIPVTSNGIRQYCQDFYDLFARFDAFLAEQH